MTGVSEEPLRDVAYLYDGTVEGLLTCVLTAYERREDPADIVEEGRYVPRIGQSSFFVPTCFEKADRVRKGIVREVGGHAFSAVLKASTCDDYDLGSVVLRFVRYAMARPAHLKSTPILEELANPVVADLVHLAKRASRESEKMRQFVRFSQLEGGVWFARVNPNVGVVPLVMGHFAARFNDQPFIIYDEVHHMAGVYDGRKWQLVRDNIADALPQATSHDLVMQEAWKRFYDVLAVDARYNPELRLHFMPVRLWENLTEMQPRRTTSGSTPAFPSAGLSL